MTKKFLLAATAIAAIGFGGAAFADEVTTATVSGETVLNGATATPFAVASETVSSSATRLSGTNSVAIAVEDGFVNGSVYEYTFALNGAVFPASVAGILPTITGADADFDAACFVVANSAGGASGSSSVTYRVTTRTAVNGTCDAAALLVTDTDFDLAWSGWQFRASQIGSVGVSVTGGLSSTNPVVGAEAHTLTKSVSLAAVVPGYEAVVDGALTTAAGTDTRLSLTPEPAYTSLTGDANIGEVGFAKVDYTGADYAVDGTNNAFLGYNTTSLPNVVSDIELTISGTDFETLIPAGYTVDADDVTLASNSAVSGITNVNIAAVAGLTDAIATGTVTVEATVTPDFAAGAVNTTAVSLPEAVSGVLEPVELQGTSFLAPWIQSSNPNYNTVIRLSNMGSRPTGSIQLALASPLRAPTATTCALSGIPANGEVSINSAQLTSCFGDFGRGDVTVTILSLGSEITAKLRIVNPGNIVSEQSLGRTSGNQ